MSRATDPSIDFKSVQRQFTQHMRDPEQAPAPADIEDRRMDIYRGLLYRNVEGFMANSFPVLRKVTNDENWHDMIRDYFKNHQAQTPLFPKMPQEFLQYLEQERQNESDPPWMLELAHYEWIEMSLMLDAREISTGKRSVEVTASTIPKINPLTMVLTYQYPVHKIGPKFIPDEAPETPSYLLVYRDEKDEVGFIELNPVSARLIQIVAENDKATVEDILTIIVSELNHPNPDVVIQGGLDILRDFSKKGVIL